MRTPRFIRSILPIAVFILTIVVLWVGCKKSKAPEDHQYSNDWIDSAYKSHGYGLIRLSPAEYAKIPTASLPTGATGNFDKEFELEIPTHPFNQERQGSCSACATAMAKSILDKKFLNVSFPSGKITYSPAYLYHQTIDIPGVCDIGSSTPHNLDILLNKGICLYSDMPYKNEDCTTQPSPTQNYNAAAHKIFNWQKIDLKTATIKEYIKSGIPIVVGFKVDTYFALEYYKQENKNKPWKVFGTPASGNNNHATLLYGWSDANNSFKMLNEWGDQWGNNGSIYVDYSLVENSDVFFEAYMMVNPAGSVNDNALQVSGTLKFGDVPINTSTTQTIQLTNSGNANIQISNLTIGAPFSTNWNGNVIQPKKSVDVVVTFSPKTTGAVSQNLTIESDATNSPSTLPATGNGTQQTSNTRVVSIAGDLSFGNLTIGTNLSKFLTITNNGNSPLNIYSISLPFGFSGSFSGVIQPGSSTMLQIYFTPSNVQQYNGNVIINSDATSGGNSVSASGNGQPSGNSSSATSIPAIGTYGTCGSVGATNICTSPSGNSVYSNGVINARVVSINTSSHQITFEINKCNGTSFNAGGKYNIVSDLCSGTSYAFGAFQAGNSSFQVTINDNNMVGTKVYYPFIIQGTSLDIFYNAPYIIVTY